MKIASFLPSLALLAAVALGSAGCDGDGPELLVPFDASVVEPEIPAVLTALREGRPQDALDALQRLEDAGTLPDGALHYRAIALMDLGRDDEARAAWDAELAAHPGNGKALVFRAMLQIEAGELEAARASLAAARPLLSDFPAWSLVSGRLGLLTSRDADALRDFTDYLTLDPYGADAAECHQGLAQIHAARNEPDSAARARFHADRAEELENVHRYRAAYRARVAEDPEDTEALLGLANTELSLYFEFSPRVGLAGDPRLLAGAEVPLLRLVALEPGHAGALANLGSIRAEQRRFDEAAEYFTRATEADPSAPLPWLHLGRLELKAGRADAAVAAFETALATATEDGDRGRILAELGAALLPLEPARALEHLEAYLSLFPTDPAGLRGEAEALRERLGSAGTAPAGGDG